MLFARLHKKRPNGSPWTRSDTIELGIRWKEQLWLGGIEVTPYDVESHVILLTLKVLRGKL